METTAPTPPTPQALYHITPRYLAGADDDTPARVLAVLEAAGWMVWSDDLANTHALDPRHQLAVQFLPEGRGFLDPGGHVLWRMWGRRSRLAGLLWLAEFTDDTPHEILLPLATALTTDPDAAHPQTTVATMQVDGEAVLKTLMTAGWHPDPTGQPLNAHAPGLHATLTQHDGLWHLHARPAPASEPLWVAELSAATPRHLLDALCQTLTDPTPALRHDLPTASGGHVTLALATPEPLP